MTLELNQLTQTVQEMGQALARRQASYGQLVKQAQTWLATFADQGPALRKAAPKVPAAIPTEEPLNAFFPLPSLPERFTVIGADGTQIQPDRHATALYYLINIGSLVYRHGSGQTPEARSSPDLRYQDEDLYEGSLLVAGNLLDVRRDQSELAELANLVEQESAGPTLALIDGTLLLWLLEDSPLGSKKLRTNDYLAELARIQERGAAVAAFTSRPRYTDVGRLLHLAQIGGDSQQAKAEPNPLERVPDRSIFSFLPPGTRSALFLSPGELNRKYYAPQGHGVHFFYVNVAQEGDPVIARVEIPAWVVKDGDHGSVPLLDLAHGGVVAQSRIAGGFPYVLARADELAFISGPERERLGEMVGTALLGAGLPRDLSPKAYYKSLTRQGRRW